MTTQLPHGIVHATCIPFPDGSVYWHDGDDEMTAKVVKAWLHENADDYPHVNALESMSFARVYMPRTMLLHAKAMNDDFDLG